MNLILNKSLENKLPLWLSYICNELRVFGEFATINRKIEQLPSDMESLISNIVSRINSDFRDNIVIEVLYVCKGQVSNIQNYDSIQKLWKRFFV